MAVHYSPYFSGKKSISTRMETVILTLRFCLFKKIFIYLYLLFVAVNYVDFSPF